MRCLYPWFICGGVRIIELLELRPGRIFRGRRELLHELWGWYLPERIWLDKLLGLPIGHLPRVSGRVVAGELCELRGGIVCFFSGIDELR